jgi:hypothetical protein
VVSGHGQELVAEFLTMTRLKISTIRFDGASKFGKSSFFMAYCKLPLGTRSLPTTRRQHAAAVLA